MRVGSILFSHSFWRTPYWNHLNHPHHHGTLAMHGFTPEHALHSANAFMIYFGLPMVAKYDRYLKEYVKASPAYIQKRMWQVMASYVYTGTVYSVYLMFPDYFPTMGVPETEHYFSLRHIFTLRYLRNATYYLCKFDFKVACRSEIISCSTSYQPLIADNFNANYSDI
jgi:hypothetical protein